MLFQRSNETRNRRSYDIVCDYIQLQYTRRLHRSGVAGKGQGGKHWKYVPFGRELLQGPYLAHEKEVGSDNVLPETWVWC